MVKAQGNNQNISISATGNVSTPNVNAKPVITNTTVESTNNLAKYYSEISQDWAVGEGLIQGIDYSSKTYALQAKESATEAKTSLDEAKGYADNAVEQIQNVENLALSNISMLEQSVSDSIEQGIQTIGETSSQTLTDLQTASNGIISEIEELNADVIEEINDLADTVLEEIADAGGGDNLKYNNITNCLLEVPQRIKYTLEDGTLTIKAGSQVIVPYGLEYSRETEGSDVDYSMVTIEDGVASGFGENNYIELQPLDEVGNEVDMRFKIRTGNLDNMEQEQYILESWDDIMADTYGISLCIEMDKTLSVQVQDGYLTSDYELQSNTDYWVKVKNQTGTLRLYISLDGSTNVAQFIDQERLRVNWNGANIYLGGRDYPFQGSIDFNDSFMKVNGLDYWSYTAPPTEEFRSIVEDYPVGSTFLNENFKVADRMVVDGKFFVWAEIQEDSSLKQQFNDENISIAFNLSGGIISTYQGASGTSTPGSTTSYASFYNTTTNMCLFDRNGWEQITLPIMIVDRSAEVGYTKVRQVFNGFGYIGSTIWVDKGVKGLIPNRRNEDYTLKNIEITTNAISTKSYVPNNTASNVYFGINNDGAITLNGLRKYDEKNNIIYNGTNIHTMVECGIADFNKSGITSFTPKQPFRAIGNSEFDDLLQSNNKLFDGQVTYTNRATIFNNTTVGTYAVDLSSYVPNDGCGYDLYVTCSIGAGSDADGSDRNIAIYDATGVILAMFTSDAINKQIASNAVLMLKPSTRAISVSLTSTNSVSFSRAIIYLNAVRRRGTNA